MIRGDREVWKTALGVVMMGRSTRVYWKPGSSVAAPSGEAVLAYTKRMIWI